jgi:hypothetical protein
LFLIATANSIFIGGAPFCPLDFPSLSGSYCQTRLLGILTGMNRFILCYGGKPEEFDVPCGRKRKLRKIATHKRKKKLRKNRHKNK